MNDHTEMISGDKVVLRGLIFHGYHGVYPEENKLGQKFLVDVDAWTDLQAAADSDNLSDSVSYTSIYRVAKEVLEGPPLNLVECVAQRIATGVLSKSNRVSAVRVCVGKPHIAVAGPVEYLGIEITRQRSPAAQT